jgi:predicted lysophospholipase L1 biosynthesis ABC-type transport system permease subunit
VGVTLTSIARRRRRDVAVLRSIGFAPAQVRTLVSAQVTTFLVIAAAVGLPLGIAIGRQAWGAAANSLGADVAASLPALRVAAATAMLAVLFNLVAQAVAAGASRRRPAGDLRVE